VGRDNRPKEIIALLVPPHRLRQAMFGDQFQLGRSGASLGGTVAQLKQERGSCLLAA